MSCISYSIYTFALFSSKSPFSLLPYSLSGHSGSRVGTRMLDCWSLVLGLNSGQDHCSVFLGTWLSQSLTSPWCVVNPFTPKLKNLVHPPNLYRKKYRSDAVSIGSIIIIHLSKLWKAKFFISVWCIISGEAAGKIWVGFKQLDSGCPMWQKWG